jgi:hypothetical protein
MANHLPNMRVGDEYTLKIVIKKEDGTAQDITGYKFWITLKGGADLATAAAVADIDAGLQHETTAGDQTDDDLIGGVAYLVIPSTVMQNVVAGDYFYDVQAKKPGANGEGIITLLPPITDVEDVLTVYPDITKAVA